MHPASTPVRPGNNFAMLLLRRLTFWVLHLPFMCFLSLVWAITSGISFRFPGDEYGLWVLSSIAGSWILWFAPSLQAGQQPHSFLYWVLLAGALTTAFLGYFLDRLNSPRIPFLATWLGVAVLLALVALAQYPSIDHGVAKNGSPLAYFISAANISLTGTSLLFLIIAAVVTTTRRYLLQRAGTRTG